MLNRGPHLTSPKERNKAQPLLFGDTDNIGFFESGE
jgi:hypothetical protein